MPEPRNPITRAASRVGDYLDRSTLRARPLRRRAPLVIEAYLGHGTPERLYVTGRVREDNGIREAAPADSTLRNLRNTYRRVTRREAGGVRVRARFQGIEQEAVSSRRGFFDFEIELPQPLPAGKVWHEVELRLVDEPPREPAGGVCATARVLVPPASAEFGIISDIDDTVVRTDVTDWLRMLRIVLLTNAHTRMPFDHVDTLYRALQLGPRGRSYNPIFYISSSPWSFYDLLEHFFRAHDIPVGPLFLKKYAFSRQHLRSGTHHTHKLRWIRMLFDTHPDLSWVLIGDSGQQDPEIYRETVREYPGRVRAVYIRDVTTPARDAEVHAIADEVAALGVEMRLVQETVEAGEHAAARGLITHAALAEMRAEAEEDAETGLLDRVDRVIRREA